jgi:hypothetical protein
MKVFATVAEAILGDHPSALSKMQLPDSGPFARNLRTEIDLTNEMVAGLALGRSEKVLCSGTDATPLDQKEYCGASALLRETVDGEIVSEAPRSAPAHHRHAAS